MLAGSPHQAQTIGVPVKRDTTLHNGPLECTLAFYDVDEGGGPAAGAADAPRSARAAVRSSAAALAARKACARRRRLPPGAWRRGAERAGRAQTRPAGLLTGGAEQFANRLHKNVRRLSRQLRREDITCYRLYDADLPDYNLVDRRVRRLGARAGVRAAGGDRPRPRSGAGSRTRWP